MKGGLRPRLFPALATIGSAAASFGCMLLMCAAAHARSGPAILAALLALSFSRRPRARSTASAVRAAAILAATGVAAAGVAACFALAPAVGAVAFTGGMFVSVWLRNFGSRARAVGSAIAMPLAAILIAPSRAAAPGGPLVDVALAVGAGLIAYLFSVLAGRLAGTPPVPEEHSPVRAGAAVRRASLSPSTRFAVQTAVALGAAFGFGFGLFAGHWGWCVFSAFIVGSGSRSRGDTVYKGVLRFGGAAAGTAAAALLDFVWRPTGALEAVLIFAVLFAGLVLRASSYAYWAAAMTLVLALLTAPDIATAGSLVVRLEAIAMGALCATAAAWYIFPIKAEAVIRRRLADALAALDDVLAHLHGEQHPAKMALLEARMTELEDVAEPVRLHRRLFARREQAGHPAGWIDRAAAVHRHARALERDCSGPQRIALRRSLTAARRAVGAHGKTAAAGDGTGSIADRLDDLASLLERSRAGAPHELIAPPVS